MIPPYYRICPESGLVYGWFGKPLSKKDSDGYIQAKPTQYGPGRMVHCLIWESVHGPIPDGMQINHINGIKADNRIANLELVTPSQNTLHAYRLGLRRADGEFNGRAIGKRRSAA